MKKKVVFFVLLFFVSGFFLTSCKKNKEDDKQDPDELVEVKFEVLAPEGTERIVISGSFENDIVLKEQEEKFVGTISLKQGEYTYNYYNGDSLVYVELSSSNQGVTKRKITVANEPLVVKDTVANFKYRWIMPISIKEFDEVGVGGGAHVEGVIIYNSSNDVFIVNEDVGLYFLTKDQDLTDLGLKVGDKIRVFIEKRAYKAGDNFLYHLLASDKSEIIKVSENNELSTLHNIELLKDNTYNNLFDYEYQRITLESLEIKKIGFYSGGSRLFTLDSKYGEIVITIYLKNMKIFYL